MTTTTTKVFQIRNLAEQTVDTGRCEPWVDSIPIPRFETREAYQKWMHQPESVVPLFSMVEGTSPNMRVNAANPAYRVHGIICDYDTALTEAEVAAGLKRIPGQFPLYAWNRTRRGGIRLVFRFAEPAFYYGRDTYERLMKRAKKDLKLSSLFPGLDEDVLLKSDQYYAAGDKWTVNESAFIKAASVYLWLFDVLGKTDDFDGADVEVPFPVLEAEVHKRFPGRWQGEFREGARGVRWWDPTADNPTGALIRKTGVTCFTGPDPFMSWKRIFGREFVSAYLEDTQGKALANLWCDSRKRYYRQLQDESWDLLNTEQVKRHLKAAYGMSDSVEKGEAISEVDLVIHKLEMSKRVEGGVPFPHNKETIVEWNGSTFLNTSTCRLITPALDPQEWGVNFPWIARYVDRLMKDDKNKDVLLTATAHWLRGCYDGKPTRGHVVFLAGPPETGKTFWTRRILARIAGGCADVSRFFTGQTKYNDAAFAKALWVIDDASALSDKTLHRAYSGNIKACAANPTFTYAQKFAFEGDAPFSGRMWVTLNNDSTSLEMLPDTEQSILDKVIFLMTSDKKPEMAERESERYEIVDQELPYFVRWLLDMPTPKWLESNSRFGFRAWQDPELLDEARSSTPTNAVMEAICAWRADFTPEDGKKKDQYWEGTIGNLLASLMAHSPQSQYTVGKMNSVWFGRHITQMIRTGCDWITFVRRDRDHGKIYRIKML